MGMIRGKVYFGDGGRGLAAIGLNNRIVRGDSKFYYKNGKWFCKDTGKEAKVLTVKEFLKG